MNTEANTDKQQKWDRESFTAGVICGVGIFIVALAVVKPEAAAKTLEVAKDSLDVGSQALDMASKLVQAA